MDDLVKVCFIRNAPPYFQGDVAGWPVEKAAELIKLGLAVEDEIGAVESGAKPEISPEVLEVPEKVDEGKSPEPAPIVLTAKPVVPVPAKPTTTAAPGA